MSNPIALPEIFQAAFEDFIIPSYETAPNTTIQNRAKVTRSLKAVAGVERIITSNLPFKLMETEFGSNGEMVFGFQGESRLRAVGTSWYKGSNSGGTWIYSPSTSGLEYVEIIFYGTGLNFITGSVISRDVRASVDGGVESSNIMPTNFSNALDGRNYHTGVVLPVASGLTLGWHIVKLRSVVGLHLEGFEVLNERTNLAVYPGTGVSNGSSQGLSALTTSAFKAGVVGTRGARVVKYVQGGIVSQAVQEVDATSKYLTLADHANEEVIRRINYREFGANRADDFSTLSTSRTAAFTLDDGTTTLVGSAVSGGGTPDSIGFPTTGTSSISLTFVGTGLDIVATSVVGFVGSISCTIDGVSVGSITSSSIGTRIAKVASGLPYGTHTCKLLLVAASSDWALLDFITYRPKTPSIPAGALKVAAYNVMADFSATAIVSADAISSGVLSKSQAREMTYVGTWAAALNVTVKNGIVVSSSTVGNYVEYTFWGTGFSIAANVGVSGTATLAVDGSNYSGATVTAGSIVGAVWTMATTNGGRLRVSGLSLGLHKVRLTITTNVGALFVHGIDIITPIHAQESSFKVGSNSLKSVTKYSPEKSVANAGPDLSKAKAWVWYDGINLQVLASYNVSAVVRASAGDYTVYLEKPFKDNKYIPSLTASTRGGSSRVLGTFLDYAVKPNSFRMTYASTTNGAIVSVTPDDTLFVAVFFGEQIDE